MANQFRACCALYNLLHELDGFQAHQRWGAELALAKLFAQPSDDQVVPRTYGEGSYLDEYDAQELTDEDLETLHRQFTRKSKRHSARMQIVQQALGADFDASYVGTNPATDLSDDPTEVDDDWATLRNKLVGHYAMATAANLVRWLFYFSRFYCITMTRHGLRRLRDTCK